MSERTEKLYWCGTAIEDLTREQLEHAYRHLFWTYQRSVETARMIRNMKDTAK